MRIELMDTYQGMEIGDILLTDEDTYLLINNPKNETKKVAILDLHSMSIVFEHVSIEGILKNYAINRYVKGSKLVIKEV